MSSSNPKEFGQTLLSSTTRESPILAANKLVYFHSFVPALQAVGAKRKFSISTSAGHIVDEYEGPNGEHVFVGYRAGAIRRDDPMYIATRKLLDSYRQDPNRKVDVLMLEALLDDGGPTEASPRRALAENKRTGCSIMLLLLVVAVSIL